MNTKLNQVIAEAKGLNYFIEPDTHELMVYNPDTGGYDVKDYTKDPVLILELVIELGEAYWSYYFDEKHHCWHNKIACLDDIHKYKLLGDEDFGLCACMAWCEMKGISY